MDRPALLAAVRIRHQVVDGRPVEGPKGRDVADRPEVVLVEDAGVDEFHPAEPDGPGIDYRAVPRSGRAGHTHRVGEFGQHDGMKVLVAVDRVVAGPADEGVLDGAAELARFVRRRIDVPAGPVPVGPAAEQDERADRPAVRVQFDLPRRDMTGDPVGVAAEPEVLDVLVGGHPDGQIEGVPVEVVEVGDDVFPGVDGGPDDGPGLVGLGPEDGAEVIVDAVIRPVDDGGDIAGFQGVEPQVDLSHGGLRGDGDGSVTRDSPTGPRLRQFSRPVLDLMQPTHRHPRRPG